MLGGAICGAWHRFGRTSVMPDGHSSPGLMVASGPPPLPWAQATFAPKVSRDAAKAVNDAVRMELQKTRTRNLTTGTDRRNVYASVLGAFMLGDGTTIRPTGA